MRKLGLVLQGTHDERERFELYQHKHQTGPNKAPVVNAKPRLGACGLHQLELTEYYSSS